MSINSFVITSPIDQFEIRNFISLDAPLFGNLHLSLTNIGLYLTISAFLVLICNLLAQNYNKVISNNWSISQETLYATIHSIVINQINSKNGQIYFPFVYTLFIFILVNNLIGMVPYSFASTSHFIFTFSLSFSVVLGATIVGFKKHGLEFFSLLVPAGCPLALLRAPCEVLMFTRVWSDLSCIYDRINVYDARRGYSRLGEPISHLVWEAEYKWVLWCGLPHKEDYLNGSSHVEADKPDTYKCLEAADNVSSRIYRYYYNVVEAYGNRCLSCHKVVHSQKETTKSPIGDKQAAKTTRTLNVTSVQPRDITASTLIRVRGIRSFHSSACTKGNSITSSKETIDNNLEKPVSKVKSQKVAKRVGVTTIARKLLDQNKVSGQKYYKIMNIIADPNFLVACYD